jgi:peptide/nickel transport system permease protein
MTRFIARRLLLMIPVLFFVSLIVFSLIALIPGDPARIMLGEEASREALEVLRKQMGLDRPLLVRYLIWMGRVVQGDLGQSVRDGRSVALTLTQKIPVTAELALTSLLIAWAIAIPAGALAAWKRRSMVDYAATTVSLAGISIPNFWLGIMLIYLLAVNWRWLPPSGYVEPWIDLGRNLRLMIMPSIVLVVRHALKNAMIPVATIMGLQLGGLLGGAVITETIFAVPGVGRLAVESILTRDYPMVQGVVLFAAVAVVAVNLLVDVAYALLDPRIRLEERA